MIERNASFDYEPKDGKLSYRIEENHTYLPDFRLGNGVIVECKGRLTPKDRKKLKLVKDGHPDKDIRLVFQYNNKLNPRSKTRYSDWAEKNGFLWAVKDIPQAWLDELQV